MSNNVDEREPQYAYTPNLGAGIFFTLAFFALTVTTLALVVKSRIWWLSVLVVGGIGEVIGWIGRLIGSKQVWNRDAFMTQIVCLIISPCFFSAGLYGILGPQYSVIRPGFYLAIFVTADLLAIIIQAIGGSMATSSIPATSQNGTHIMVGGVTIQLIAMVGFVVLAFMFWKRQRHARFDSSANLGLLFFGIAWSSFWILLRCIYRVIELAEGWHGNLLTHEPYFIVLDAVPMLLTLAGFIYAWPSRCLPNAAQYVSNKALAKGQGSSLLPSVDGSPSKTADVPMHDRPLKR